MKQVKNVLAEYDSVLVKALKFLHRVEEQQAMVVHTVNDEGNDSTCDANDSEVVENDANTLTVSNMYPEHWTRSK